MRKLIDKKVLIILLLINSCSYSTIKQVERTSVKKVKQEFSLLNYDTCYLQGYVKRCYINEPVAYASVLLINENKIVYCDSLGFYKMIIPKSKNKISISCIGYKSAVFNTPKFESDTVIINFFIKKSSVMK